MEDLPKWCQAAFVYDLPLAVPFRGLTRRTGMIFRTEVGVAEWSPFAEYDVDEAAAWWQCTVEAAKTWPPALQRDSVPVNAIIPAVDAEVARRLVVEAGCDTVKIKVAQSGQMSADDVARVDAVRRELGPHGRVRVDANGAWDVEAALEMCRRLQPFGLEYVEQPCATVEELAQLRRGLARAGIDVPIAADESIRRADDPHEVARREAADVMVLKVQPLGGIARCLALAADIGLPAVVSSAVETSVGLSYGVALAATLPSLPFACGLNTGRLLAADVSSTPVVAEGGQLSAHAKPDADLVEAHLADAATTRWWWDRLAAVRQVTGR